MSRGERERVYGGGRITGCSFCFGGEVTLLQLNRSEHEPLGIMMHPIGAPKVKTASVLNRFMGLLVIIP